jgi:hypothetical protein
VVLLLGGKLVIGVGKQDVPGTALQQRDIVLYMDGGAVFDDFFFVRHHGLLIL